MGFKGKVEGDIPTLTAVLLWSSSLERLTWLIRLELLFPAGVDCDIKRGEVGDFGCEAILFVMWVRGPSVEAIYLGVCYLITTLN